jgi:hypothetical protein
MFQRLAREISGIGEHLSPHFPRDLRNERRRGRRRSIFEARKWNTGASPAWVIILGADDRRLTIIASKA